MLKKIWKAIVLGAVVATSLTTTSVSAADRFLWDLFHQQSDCIQFTATEEALFIGRDSRVSSDGSVINGPDSLLLEHDNADFNHEFGYRVSLGIQSPERRVEAIFGEYGDWAWRETGQLTTGLSFDGGAGFPAGTNQLGVNTLFRPLFDAATAAVDETDGLGPDVPGNDPFPTYENFYSSNLQDLQINVLDNSPLKTVRVGVGYRNVQLDELSRTVISGSYRAYDDAGPDGGLSSADLTGAGLTFFAGPGIVDDGFQDGGVDQLTLSHRGSTANNLNGFQFITDLCLVDRPRFGISMIGKAGAYHNHASGRVSERYTSVGGNASTYGVDYSDSSDGVAFLGGVAVKARLKLTDHLRLIGGYEGLFVSGVALAPEQAAGVREGTYQVQADGNVIVHGANFGLELTY